MQVCRSKHSSLKNLLYVHTPLVHKAGPYISPFRLEGSQRLSRKVCDVYPFPFLSLFASLLLAACICGTRIVIFPVVREFEKDHREETFCG